MIYSKLSDANCYRGLSKGLDRAIEWLENADFTRIEDGRYDLDGPDFRAIISTASTVAPEEAVMESHKKYIDLQYIIEGEENFFVEHLEEMGAPTSENAERDIYFYKGAKKEQMILVPEGYFMILFPQDAHATRVMTNEPKQTRKVILKVRF